MATKTKSEPDLRTLRDALDAPARAKADAEARAREAEQRTRQDALLAYARRIVTDLEPAAAAVAAWDAAPVNMPAFRATFGEGVPVGRAFDHVNSGSHPITDAARVAGEVDRLTTELAQPALLPAARLAAILTALDRAAGHAEGFIGVYAVWIRVREDAVALLPAIRALLDALERRWTPTATEHALLVQQQQRFAAAAMPPTPPAAPRRGVSGARLDAPSAGQPVARRPMLETMEDL